LTNFANEGDHPGRHPDLVTKTGGGVGGGDLVNIFGLWKLEEREKRK